MKLFHFLQRRNAQPVKLFLHAGTHKTGTTAIQAFAASHRRKLLRRGLLYPEYYPLIKKNQEAHHWFAHALADTDGIPLSAESAPLLVRGWYKKARRRRSHVFVSAEALYRHLLGKGTYEERRLNYLSRIAETLDDFDVHVILVFRRPDDYIRSLYQERVMRAFRPLPDFKKFYQKVQKGYEYHLNTTLFQQVFPHITCLVYEDLDSSNDFFTRFFRAMDIDVSDLNGVGVVRKSFCPAETLVKNFANHYLKDKKEVKTFLHWMQTPPVADRIKTVYGDTPYDLWPGHEARQEFLAGRRDDLENLRCEFFPGRDTLFPPLNEGDTLPPVPPLPDELKRMVLDYFGRKEE